MIKARARPADPAAARMSGPWRVCRCGHLMLLHDVEDMEGSNPSCCVDGCDQRGCRAEGDQT